MSKKKCNLCGLCLELCPRGNIAVGPGGRIVWGRDCLLCLYCELRCPTQAITSPASWPLFRPFMMYNVWRASGDPLVDHEMVDTKAPLHLRGEHLRAFEVVGRPGEPTAETETAQPVGRQ